MAEVTKRQKHLAYILGYYCGVHFVKTQAALAMSVVELEQLERELKSKAVKDGYKFAK